jgi:hypothetical protein
MKADHQAEGNWAAPSWAKENASRDGMRVDPANPREGSYALTSDPIFSPSTTRRIFP